MKIRVISGAVLTVILAAVLALNSSFPLILNIAVAFMSLMGVHELCCALSLNKKWLLYIPSLIVAATVPMLSVLPVEGFLVYAVYAFVLFVGLIVYFENTKFTEVATLFAMGIIIPTGLGTIALARDLSPAAGTFYAMIAILGAWIPDTGAYFAGTLFGKHKLCPVISPKKTVEGFVGGIVCSGVITILLGVVWNLIFKLGSVNIITLLVLGLGGAVVSVVGDLTFSILKRNHGIKDYGKLIPGHGGILDRFDSVIFTAPYVYIILSLLPAVFTA